MTLNDDLIFVIYLLCAYCCASFAWFWIRWQQLTGKHTEELEDGKWYDWVLCVPVIMMAGVIGILFVIFTKADEKFTKSSE